MGRLNVGQRVVVVIGIAAGLWFFGQWVTGLGLPAFIAYAPLSHSVYSPAGGLAPWARLLVWLGLVLVWVATSLVVLRSASSPRLGSVDVASPSSSSDPPPQ